MSDKDKEPQKIKMAGKEIGGRLGVSGPEGEVSDMTYLIDPKTIDRAELTLARDTKATAEHAFLPKLTGWELYKSIGSPKYIVAPMVDQSGLAWRVLSRRYNADLFYAPHVQRQAACQGFKFCANDPEYLLQATLMVGPYCDAVDINLGCPQHIARRGHYGSPLMEDWPLISSLISTLHKHLPTPVTAKIRVLPEVEKTTKYVRKRLLSLARSSWSFMADSGR
ncbi:hypothetical protein BC939DRAFT_504485 [Gamsiella multidivaricata]|uniref:uncharacterized protein n=1 Tax=Gamsiella multidivaricata TaxID=101098 RepID=UPI00221EF504|nr:uncharacterized protein BC939DRAFT_504485 [Gamsiella multidivaricata]KAI7821169.1 hypothetical protein BC939DRAFT_504485 [Gamsiella multidivaricata]